MSAHLKLPVTTMSTRLIAPFARVLTRASTRGDRRFNFRSSSNRVLHDRAMEMLEEAVRASRDPLLGLSAAQAALGGGRLPSPSQLRDRVRSHLREQLVDGSISAGGVARRFRISERTLRRHLSAEGTSYAALLDQTREELATSWLSSGERAITDIAVTLGFSHVSSFYKAFRRWTGQTPVEYRHGRRSDVVTEPPPRSVVRSDVVPQPDALVASAALQRS